MSDKEGVAPEYEARDPKALDALREVVASKPIAGYQYVAEPAPGWDTHGVWSSFGTEYRSGYSVHAAAATYAIAEGLKIPMQLVPHRHIDIDPEKFPADRRDMYGRWHDGRIGLSHLLVASYPPIEAAYLKDLAPRLVCYTAHEAATVSTFAAKICNENFDETWLVSEFARRAFADSGVQNARTVRPMLSGGPWQPKATTPRQGTFVFGTQGTWHARKGMLDLVRAYYGEFSATDDVLLEIRTSQMGGRRLSIDEFLGKVADDIRGEKTKFSKALPRVKVYAGTDLTDAEVIAWLGGLSGYVNPSYGEGLGIPPLWAAMSGVPVVTSTFGALGEYFGQENQSASNRLFAHHLTRVDPSMPATNRIYDHDQLWGGYEVADLAAAMRQVYAQGQTRDLALAGRTQSDFSLDAAVAALRPRLQALLPEAQQEAWL
jgi:glycosyltransferase involved in cell wall biosynthesis